MSEQAILTLTITPRQTRANAMARFEEFREELKKATGSVLDKRDLETFKSLFLNGYVAAMRDFSEGKVPVDVAVADDNKKTC